MYTKLKAIPRIQSICAKKETKCICESITTMLTRVVFILAAFTFILLEKNITNCYKTLADLKARFKNIEKEEFSASDVFVGKAMDFMYSNKTMMGLIAGELWNAGAKALDKIVELKPKGKKGSKHTETFPERPPETQPDAIVEKDFN